MIVDNNSSRTWTTAIGGGFSALVRRTAPIHDQNKRNIAERIRTRKKRAENMCHKTARRVSADRRVSVCVFFVSERTRDKCERTRKTVVVRGDDVSVCSAGMGNGGRAHHQDKPGHTLQLVLLLIGGWFLGWHVDLIIMLRSGQRLRAFRESTSMACMYTREFWA